MTLPHYFCLCSYLCLVVIVRINVILSIYFYLFLEYMRTLTPKWIVFHFLNFWKLGEGGKMNKVLGMLEAGNAACKANSIHKTMSFSFSPQNGGYNHLFLFHLTAVFWEGVSAFEKDCLRCSPIQPGSSTHGSWITLALCATKCVTYTCEDWSSSMIKTWLKRQTRKLGEDFHGSLGEVIFLEELKYVFNFTAIAFFCFQLRTTAGERAPLLLQTFVEVVT